MKILLTGSNGYLGKHIYKELAKTHETITLSKTNADYCIDLSVNNFTINHDFDCIIHCAGLAHMVPRNKLDKESFFNVNVKGTENLLKGIELNGTFPKWFVFISTVAVYGVEEGVNINENTPLLAKDPYGFSKIQAEKLVLDWCLKNNVTYTILRLPLVVGENPPGNLGAMIKAIQKGYYFNIAGGKARKSMVLASDVAKIILKASKIGGVFNLSDGYNPNFHELSNAIALRYGKSKLFNLQFFIAKSIALVGDVLGTKLPLNSHKLKKITSDLTFDDTKARNVLGWNPKKVLEYYAIRKIIF